jgi:CRAL/TRIO domain
MHRYMRATAEVMQEHYPDRQARIVLINAPWWFAGAWRGFAGVLSASTTSKLQVTEQQWYLFFSARLLLVYTS